MYAYVVQYVCCTALAERVTINILFISILCTAHYPIFTHRMVDVLIREIYSAVYVDIDRKAQTN